ncbi:MAG TPA: hypothetical protein VFG21_01410 [Xanthomonadaceae bacterium]|nr:hypothetical protein [Xanthomonadaceae bacterium]
MSFITTDDGVYVHVEETGSGAPLPVAHEFAGDHRGWEPQVRYFARPYRCISDNACRWREVDTGAGRSVTRARPAAASLA